MANIILDSRLKLWNDNINNLMDSETTAHKGEVMVAYDGEGNNVVDIRIGNNTIFQNSQRLNFKNRINITDFSNVYDVGEFSTLFTIKHTVTPPYVIKIQPLIEEANIWENIGANTFNKHYIFFDNSTNTNDSILDLNLIKYTTTTIYTLLGETKFLIPKNSYGLIEFSIFAKEPDDWNYYFYSKQLYPTPIVPSIFSIVDYEIFIDDTNWAASTKYAASGYNWSYTIFDSRITANSYVDIEYPLGEILNTKNFAPVYDTIDGGLIIYGKEKMDTGIPRIIVMNF